MSLLSINNRYTWGLFIFIALVLIVNSTIFVFNQIGNRLCIRHPIDVIYSPENFKKIEIFTFNCGATVGWTTHASIVDFDKDMREEDSGNVLRVSSNQGNFWPKDSNGWPIVKVKWSDSYSVTLYYSMNSELFYKRQKFEGINVEFVPITPQVVREEGWEF